jgi:hypothetical protein
MMVTSGIEMATAGELKVARSEALGSVLLAEKLATAAMTGS